MRLQTRSEALRLAFTATALVLPNRRANADTYNPGETPAELSDALGGLKPGTGRSLNALIKLRAETGVERLVDTSPLFKAGQILDNLRTADGGVAEVAFSFPESWTLAGGPNLDVRDVRQSDSAFVLVAKQTKTPFEKASAQVRGKAAAELPSHRAPAFDSLAVCSFPTSSSSK